MRSHSMKKHSQYQQAYNNESMYKKSSRERKDKSPLHSEPLLLIAIKALWYQLIEMQSTKLYTFKIRAFIDAIHWTEKIIQWKSSNIALFNSYAGLDVMNDTHTLSNPGLSKHHFLSKNNVINTFKI